MSPRESRIREIVYTLCGTCHGPESRELAVQAMLGEIDTAIVETTQAMQAQRVTSHLEPCGYPDVLPMGSDA